MKDDEVLVVKRDENGELVYSCYANQELIIKTIGLIVEGTVHKMIENQCSPRQLYQFGGSLLDEIERKVMKGIMGGACERKEN